MTSKEILLAELMQNFILSKRCDTHRALELAAEIVAVAERYGQGYIDREIASLIENEKTKESQSDTL